MTGIELLKEELLKKGYSRQQINSKIVNGVLDVVSGSEGKFTEQSQIINDIEELKKKRAAEAATYERIKANKDYLLSQINTKAVELYGETKAYMRDFLKALECCETAEGRDAIKAAQIFVNSVSVDTKYDNTAYIIGLAAILSKGHTAPIDWLRKINPKIPKASVRETWRGVIQVTEEREDVI